MSEELTLEYLKEELTKRGVKFHHMAGLPKLSELWAIHSEDALVEKKDDDIVPPVDPKDETGTAPVVKTTQEPPVKGNAKAKGKYKALRNVKHNGETYKTGNKYDIREVDAKQLLKLGYIE